VTFKRILIIQTAYLGDVILATPLVEKLSAFFPRTSIDFLVRRGNEHLLGNNPNINEVITWDKKKNKYKNLLKTLISINKKRYDVVINCQRHLSTGLVTIFSNAGHLIGFDKNPLSYFFHKGVHHSIKNGHHEVNRNLSLINHLTDATFFKPKIYISKSIEHKISYYRKADYITMAPASVWFTKQFPKEKWVGFTNKLIDFDLKIYLLGSLGDYSLCEAIKNESKHNNVDNLCGKLSILESAALMRGAKMNFVNDSAPLHLASATDAPVVAIFCSTTPDFGFGPLSTTSKIVETLEDLPCKPCGLHGKKQCPEGHFKCAKTIDVGLLVDTIKRS